tara:strand:+ start:8471 stop:9661 length:1191 start_codon:yes stop_codon:yes gene_type:complete
MATAEELQQLQDELELDLNDIINNPGNYGFTEEIAVYLEGLIADADSNINTIGILARQAISNQVTLNNNNQLQMPPWFDQENKRFVTIKDEDGNPLLNADGNMQTIEIDKTTMFPSTNFFESFISSLTRSETQAIQDVAISKGYITEEDLGPEINGIKGNITNALIAEVMTYAVEEMESWYPESPERNDLINNINKARQVGGQDNNLNSLFGGVNFDTAISDDLIISREVFSSALKSFLDLKELDEAQIDIEAAKKIQSEIRQPTDFDLETELFDLYKQLNNGREMSDFRKAEFANDIAKKWSPYVQALIAQDKSIRANEVYSEYFEKVGAGAGLQEEYGGFVRFERLKPEFQAVNPLTEAQEQVKDESQEVADFEQEGDMIEQMQQSYLQWRLNG